MPLVTRVRHGSKEREVGSRIGESTSDHQLVPALSNRSSDQIAAVR